MSAVVNGEYMELLVDAPNGWFGQSLSTDPADYAVSQFQNGGVIFNSPAGSADWTDCCGSIGTILVTVTVVDGPPEPECLVDLNNDGVLDFFDISTFLTLFGAGCP